MAYRCFIICPLNSIEKHEGCRYHGRQHYNDSASTRWTSLRPTTGKIVITVEIIHLLKFIEIHYRDLLLTLALALERKSANADGS